MAFTRPPGWEQAFSWSERWDASGSCRLAPKAKGTAAFTFRACVSSSAGFHAAFQEAGLLEITGQRIAQGNSSKQAPERPNQRQPAPILAALPNVLQRDQGQRRHPDISRTIL